jgi:hypothetical protein
MGKIHGLKMIDSELTGKCLLQGLRNVLLGVGEKSQQQNDYPNEKSHGKRQYQAPIVIENAHDA